MKNYKFKINNLDCANCANTIETKLNKDKNLSDVNINFSKATITFKGNENINIIEYVNEEINKIEPGVTISTEEEKKGNHRLIDLVVGILLIGISLIVKNNLITEVLLVAAYVVLLYRIFLTAIKSLCHGVMNENFLIIISCIGAYFVNQKMEGLMVIILYTIGKILEEKAIYNSRKSISELMDIRVDKANLKDRDTIIEVEPEKLNIGDIIIVKKGEKVPVDGKIIKGYSNLDTQALSGEAKSVAVKPGDEILSGCINLDGLLEVKVQKKYEDSSVSKILNLLENANDKKAKRETKVNKWARIYTPSVLVLAILVAIFLPMFTDITYSQSIYRALTFLVISCPCAIAISVPLSYFSGIGVASKKGILIKGSEVLDNIKNITKIAFDKTGTLTTGKFNITKITSLDDKYSEDDIFKYIYFAEKYSLHPLAKTVLNYKKVKEEKISDVKEFAGRGISYKYKNKLFKVGNREFVKYNPKETEETTYIYLSIENTVVGYIELEDVIKDTTKEAISDLNNENIQLYMLSGDKKNVALKIGEKTGIKNILYEMLPQDKYEKVKELMKDGEVVSFVGDGINDAPTLALSTIGISMGLNGSNAAIEASDVVIMNDDISNIKDAINISRKTNTIINENLFFAILVKISILLLSIFGLSTMWEAVFADVGVTLLAILNTIRILKMK